MSRYQIDNLMALVAGLLVLFPSGAVYFYVVRRRMSERHEIRRALLEKLPAEELLKLAGTGGGRTWLREMFGGGDDVRTGIERAMQMIFAGLACGAASVMMLVQFIGIAGIILTGAGIGQLVAVLLIARRSRTSDEK